MDNYNDYIDNCVRDLLNSEHDCSNYIDYLMETIDEATLIASLIELSRDREIRRFDKCCKNYVHCIENMNRQPDFQHLIIMVNCCQKILLYLYIMHVDMHFITSNAFTLIKKYKPKSADYKFKIVGSMINKDSEKIKDNMNKIGLAYNISSAIAQTRINAPELEINNMIARIVWKDLGDDYYIMSSSQISSILELVTADVVGIKLKDLSTDGFPAKIAIKYYYIVSILDEMSYWVLQRHTFVQDSQPQ